MKGSIHCESCDTTVFISNKEIKKYIFGKKGELFVTTRKERKPINLFSNKVEFITETFALKKDVKFLGIKCPLCQQISWKVPQLVTNPISLKESGWYILKFAKDLLEVEKVGVNINTYPCTKLEAEQNYLESIAETLLK